VQLPPPAFRSPGYKNRVNKSIFCEICDVVVDITRANQKTCSQQSCKRALRARARSIIYFENRVTPICIRCEKPIDEPDRRKYHATCWSEHNRQRVKEYYARKGTRESTGPKQKRDYKEHLVCKYCKKTVKRTAANQFSCSAKKCRNARKREAKNRTPARIAQRARAEARERAAIAKRFEEVRAAKIRRFRDSSPRTKRVDRDRAPHRIGSNGRNGDRF
jgi:hypothetical protein